MDPVTRNVNGPAAMALLAIVAARSNDSAPRRVEIPTPFFTERALFSRTNSRWRKAETLKYAEVPISAFQNFSVSVFWFRGQKLLCDLARERLCVSQR